MSTSSRRRLLCSLLLLVAVVAACQYGGRYSQLKGVIDANTGFAHFTRGANAFTLYALRDCVTDDDIPTLSQMVNDKDGVTRIAATYVLADLGDKGRDALRASIATAKDTYDRYELQSAIDASLAPGYRPILQYPMTDAERSRIHGCRKH